MEHTEHHSHDEHNTLTKRKIWQTFFILLVITILDFVVYFAMNKEHLIPVRNVIFLAFGIIKSYFIVGIFMHMSYEVKRLAMTIIIPMVFVLGLIAALLYEGGTQSVIKWAIGG